MKKDNQLVCPRSNVGGQAVLEGVMMKSTDNVSVSVRRPDGTIKTQNSKYTSIRQKNKFFRIPLIRGFVSFIESLILSYKTLNDASNLLGLEEEEEETKFEKWLKKVFGKSILDILMPISMILGIALAVFLFIILPIQVRKLIEFIINKIGTFDPVFEFGYIAKAAIEGVTKIVIFIVYLLLIKLMPDMRRTFEYHGAEHKSIFCYEQNLELTVENVKMQKRFHPRCGTSFMVVMLIIGIAVSMFIHVDNTILRTLLKLATLPIIMGVGFEFLMLSSKHTNNFIIKILMAPGLWIQRITTCEPDDSQIEVAIRSLKCSLPLEFPEEIEIVEKENSISEETLNNVEDKEETNNENIS